MKRLLVFSVLVLLTACSPSQPSPTPVPASPTTFPSMMDITVYFTYLPNFNIGTEPYEKGVTRQIAATDDLPKAVLDQLFKGPTADEKAQGLAVFMNGATGVSKVTIEDGVARVYLTGDCNSNGAAYTISNLISANLKQFPQIQWIKIYDPSGQTETPEGKSGSIPFCLEP